MYVIIMFCNFHDLHVDEYGNRQEPYGCLLFIVWPACHFKWHVIALLYLLRVVVVVVAIVSGDNHGDGAWAGDDGDHAGALEMDIKGTRKGYNMSQYWIACDVNPFMHLIFFLDSIATVAW